MTVVNEGPLCLKIHLSKYEIKKYFNSYEEINMEDPNSKRTINLLFNIAVNLSEFETKGKRLIEVFPTPSGGCILKFTSNPLPAKYEMFDKKGPLRLKNLKSKNHPYIFCFETFENLLSVIEKLYKKENTNNYTASLYKVNKKFFLKIVIPLYDFKTSIFANEYSEYSTKGALSEALLKEYAKLIIKDKAIKKLGKYFCKP